MRLRQHRNGWNTVGCGMRGASCLLFSSYFCSVQSFRNCSPQALMSGNESLSKYQKESKRQFAVVAPDSILFVVAPPDTMPLTKRDTAKPSSDY